jgi:hypothetical protein
VRAPERRDVGRNTLPADTATHSFQRCSKREQSRLHKPASFASVLALEAVEHR